MHAADVRLVLDAVREVSAVTDLAEYPVVATRVLREVVPCDGAGYNEVDPSILRIVYVTDPVGYVPDDFSVGWERWAHQHPLLAYQLDSGDGSAMKISDFLSHDEFHALELYTELYARSDIEYQIAFNLVTPMPHVIALALTRADLDFAERDREVLNELRPHFSQAYCTARAHTELKGDLGAVARAWSEQGRDVAIVAEGDELRFPVTASADRVRALLAGVDPAEFRSWLGAQRARLAGGDGPPPRARPFVLRRGDTSVVVRFLPGGAGEELVLFDDGAPGLSPDALTALGLSWREAEILALVAQGLDNEAVAARLEIAVGTVRKHLEHLYRKLGVRSRAEAVAAAFEALRGP